MTVKPKNVIISIKPEYALRILSGHKTVELRRRFPTETVEGGLAIIYASSPIKEIIGYATIDRVHRCCIDKLWSSYRKRACVEKSFFYDYFKGLDEGHALSLKNPVTLSEPLPIARMREEFLVTAPQSFRYAPKKVIDCLA